jgi:hypothetical protein
MPGPRRTLKRELAQFERRLGPGTRGGAAGAARAHLDVVRIEQG